MSSYQRLAGAIGGTLAGASVTTTSGPSTLVGPVIIPNGTAFATGLTLGNAANSPTLWNNVANGAVQFTLMDGSGNWGVAGSQLQATSDNTAAAPNFVAQYRSTTGVYIPNASNSPTPCAALVGGGVISLRAYGAGVAMTVLTSVITSSVTATAAQSNTVFNNTGASAAVTVTLPTSAAGLTYTLNNAGGGAAFAVFKAGASDKFAYGGTLGAAAGTLTSGAVYSSITITCAAVGVWQVVAATGTWAVA